MRNKIAIGLGAKIKEFRTAKELTLEKLAELSELSPRHISRIENGDSYPQGKSLEKILYALNSKPVDLYNFELVPEKQPSANFSESENSSDISELMEDCDFDILEYIENEIHRRTFIHKELNFTTSYNMIYRANKKNLFAINFFSDGTTKIIDPNENIEKMKLYKTIHEKLHKQRDNKKLLEFINQTLDFATAAGRTRPHARDGSGKFS